MIDTILWTLGIILVAIYLAFGIILTLLFDIKGFIKKLVTTIFWLPLIIGLVVYTFINWKNNGEK